MPCQPPLADNVPTGGGWIRELKHDGFRLIVRKEKIADGFERTPDRDAER